MFFKLEKSVLLEEWWHSAISRNCAVVKQNGAVSLNQGVFQLKEILIYLSLVCLPHCLFDPLWIMLAEDSRNNALTSETVGIFAGSMWVSELTLSSLCSYRAFKKTSAKYFYISLNPSIFWRFSCASHKLKSSAYKSQPDCCLLLGPFSSNWGNGELII